MDPRVLANVISECLGSMLSFADLQRIFDEETIADMRKSGYLNEQDEYMRKFVDLVLIARAERNARKSGIVVTPSADVSEKWYGHYNIDDHVDKDVVSAKPSLSEYDKKGKHPFKKS